MRENELKMRDRLVELFKQAEKQQCLNAVCGDIDSLIDSPKGAEFIADYLIANGVVALPCKVGQLAYCIIRGTYHCQMMHGTVSQVKVSKDGGSFYVSINGYFGQHYTFTDVGKNVFFTREEAERALKGGEPVCDYTKTDWNDCCECSAKDHCDKYNQRSEIIGDLLGEVIGEIKNEGR